MNVIKGLVDQSGLSTELTRYLRNGLGEAKSREEEEKEVTSDLSTLKEKLKDPSFANTMNWEFFIRLLFADLAGQSTTFAHITVINSMQNQDFRLKRVAYLSAVQIIPPKSPFRIMMISSIQKDLENSCLYNKIIALNCLPKILSNVNIGAFTEMIERESNNLQAIVRKKAILVNWRIYEVLGEKLCESMLKTIEGGLKDKDLSVVMASVSWVERLAVKDPLSILSLRSQIIDLLSSLVDQRIGRDLEYEGICAPWLQIKLLRILELVQQTNPQEKDPLVALLMKMLKSSFIFSSHTEIAVLLSLISLSFSPFIEKQIVDLAIEKVHQLNRSKLMREPDHLFIMLKMLDSMARTRKSAVFDFQDVLLNVLEAEEETLWIKAIGILFKIVSPDNFQFVLNQISRYLTKEKEKENREKVLRSFYSLLEERAISPKWFINAVFSLFYQSQSNTPPQIIYQFIESLKSMIMELDHKSIVDLLCSMFEFVHEREICVEMALSMIWMIGEMVLRNVEIPNELISIIEEFIETDFGYDSNELYTETLALSCSKIILGSMKTELKELSKKRLKSLLGCQLTYNIECFLALTERNGIKPDVDDFDIEMSFLGPFTERMISKTGRAFNNSKLIRPNSQESDLIKETAKLKTSNDQIPNPELLGREKDFEDVLKRTNKRFLGRQGISSDNSSLTSYSTKSTDKSSTVLKTVENKSSWIQKITSRVNTNLSKTPNEHTSSFLEQPPSLPQLTQPNKSSKKQKKRQILVNTLFKDDDNETIESTKKDFEKQKNNKNEEIDFLELENKGKIKEVGWKMNDFGPLNLSVEVFHELWSSLPDSQIIRIVTEIHESQLKGKFIEKGFSLISSDKPDSYLASAQFEDRPILLIINLNPLKILMKSNERVPNEIIDHIKM